MMDPTKYGIGYFPVDNKYNKWVERDTSRSRLYGARWICATAIRVSLFR